IGSLVAYAVPQASGVGLPPFIELPRANLMHYPGRGPGVLGPAYGPWGVDLAPVCRAPDAAGSCPNCFSHDDPNDPARAPGKGPKAWWDNSSCRDPSFRLPDLGSVNVSFAEIRERASLLRRLEEIDRHLEARPQQAYDAHR